MNTDLSFSYKSLVLSTGQFYTVNPAVRCNLFVFIDFLHAISYSLGIHLLWITLERETISTFK